MQRKIIVTGGAGFIGSHTVVDLVESGFEPILVDDFSNSNRSVLAGLEAICGRPMRCHDADCADAGSMRKIFAEESAKGSAKENGEGGEIAGVIHFAASKAVGESQQNPLLYYRNNLGSLITMLEVMVEFGVSDLVFSSSCTVYGQPENLPVTEATPIAAPASVYGATKQICEQIVQDTVASGAPIRATLLRYFNPIGAHPSARIGELPLGDPQNLIPIILQSAAGTRGPIQVYGDDWSTSDGSCVRDYIHVLDLAAAHVKSLQWMARQANEPVVDVLNVGTGQGTSVFEALHAFERATGKRVESIVAPRREGDIEQIYASVEKAERVLDWRAERTVDEAMRDAWRWQESLSESGA